jgi:DNA-directed RNA polymerase specialized sigma24 family protein
VPKRTRDAPRFFPETQWSLVGRAGRVSDDAHRQAIVELVKRYAPVLQSYLVYRKEIESHQAEDYVQGFLLSKVVESNFIAGASPERGRFRAFLLKSLNQYVIQQVRHEQALKRGGRGGAIALEEEMDVAGDAEPDSFDIDWARQLLSEAITRMHNECVATARKDVWEIFDARVLGPALRDQEPIGYEELVEKFALVSPAQASNLLVTGRRTFARILRSLIAEYEQDDLQIDMEIGELQKVLARAGG